MATANKTQVTTQAIVSSVIPFSDVQKKQLEEVIAKLVSKNQTVTVKYVISANDLGGFTIQIGDRKIDASLRAELRAMIENLKGTTHGK